ncbi:MAG: hypothetical protein KC442_09895 [Thermomicrobiales bacterium]|nr:hypothetical protein [Thermomicrobiales bacterium]
MLILLAALVLAPAASAQDTADVTFSPASGTAQVIAQGVAPLPAGNVVWRTVRSRALPLAAAPFEPQPLSFVLATDGPLLVTEEDGRQVHLGTGEAVLTPGGAVQQRASLSSQAVSYLSIELTPEDAPPPADNALVLQTGSPFLSPGDAHDLDLIADVLGAGEAFTVPDSGGESVILVTDGAATVGKPDGGSAVLLAGEAASFSGELLVAPAPSGGGAADHASFVVAIIGPAIPPPALPGAASPPQAPATPAASEGASATADSGSIAISVFDCPPGMTTTTFNAAACAPTEQDFDITVSSGSLAAPLTVGDATVEDGSVVWRDLPLGEYVIAEAVLPLGYSSYGLAARGANGNATLGYRVTLDAETPDLTARIYNFTGE